MTSDEMSRGSNYGDMVDYAQASIQATYSIPIFQFVELGGPYNENTSGSNYITPPEVNWAVWSSIIHGAQGIIYFNHTFAGPARYPGCDGQSVLPHGPARADNFYLRSGQRHRRAGRSRWHPSSTHPFVMDYATVAGPHYEYGTRDMTLGGLELMTKILQCDLLYLRRHQILGDTAQHSCHVHAE